MVISMCAYVVHCSTYTQAYPRMGTVCADMRAPAPRIRAPTCRVSAYGARCLPYPSDCYARVSACSADMPCSRARSVRSALGLSATGPASERLASAPRRPGATLAPFRAGLPCSTCHLGRSRRPPAGGRGSGDLILGPQEMTDLQQFGPISGLKSALVWAV